MNKEQGTRNQEQRRQPLRNKEHPNSPKRIWIINPFDPLPNESDVPLRYWALCRTLAEQGHTVIWWSSDFSHLSKQKRAHCPDTDGFSIRLIPTPPYTKNVSLARLKNHKAFARGFYKIALSELQSGKLQAPDRIVVSLPPLGVAGQAFKIRDYINQRPEARGQLRAKRQDWAQSEPEPQNKEPRTKNQEPQRSCEVIVDIMDAWPETFYQVIPKSLRNVLGPILLAPMHRSAKRAYQGADKISAVGQTYLDLASRYLNQRTDVRRQTPDEANVGARLDAPATEKHGTTNKEHRISSKPMHLCYHGTDLERFAQKTGDSSQELSATNVGPRPNAPVTEQTKTPLLEEEGCPKGGVVPDQPSRMSHQSSPNKPLKAVYLGSMGQGYDLMTILQVAARWKAEGQFPFQIHFAGTGDQLEQLKIYATQEGLLSEDNVGASLGTPVTTQQPPSTISHPSSSASADPHPPSVISHQSSLTKSAPSTISHQSSIINDSSRIVFHGYLQKDAINELLLSSDIAFVPNKPDSLVACPYKAGEYAAAGLPMISCLDGELGELLEQWNAGTEYNEGDVESLYAALDQYISQPKLLQENSDNARHLAKRLFNRDSTYLEFVKFIVI